MRYAPAALVLLLMLWLVSTSFAQTTCQLCEALAGQPTAQLVTSIDNTTQTLYITAFYQNLSAVPSRQPINYSMLILQILQQGQSPLLYSTFTNDSGNAAYNFSFLYPNQNVNPNENCTVFKVVYCPFCTGSTSSACFLECMAYAAITLPPGVQVASQLTTAPDAVPPQDAVPPATLSTAQYLPQLATVNYCPPPPTGTAATPPLCLPLVLIFALLSGALYMTGKNPFSGFNLGGAKTGRVLRYNPRGRGVYTSGTAIEQAGQAAYGAGTAVAKEGVGGALKSAGKGLAGDMKKGLTVKGMVPLAGQIGQMAGGVSAVKAGFATAGARGGTAAKPSGLAAAGQALKGAGITALKSQTGIDLGSKTVAPGGAAQAGKAFVGPPAPAKAAAPAQKPESWASKFARGQEASTYGRPSTAAGASGLVLVGGIGSGRYVQASSTTVRPSNQIYQSQKNGVLGYLASLGGSLGKISLFLFMNSTIMSTLDMLWRVGSGVSGNGPHTLSEKIAGMLSNNLKNLMADIQTREDALSKAGALVSTPLGKAEVLEYEKLKDGSRVVLAVDKSILPDGKLTLIFGSDNKLLSAVCTGPDGQKILLSFGSAGAPALQINGQSVRLDDQKGAMLFGALFAAGITESNTAAAAKAVLGSDLGNLAKKAEYTDAIGVAVKLSSTQTATLLGNVMQDGTRVLTFGVDQSLSEAGTVSVFMSKGKVGSISCAMPNGDVIELVAATKGAGQAVYVNGSAVTGKARTDAVARLDSAMNAAGLPAAGPVLGGKMNGLLSKCDAATDRLGTMSAAVAADYTAYDAELVKKILRSCPDYKQKLDDIHYGEAQPLAPVLFPAVSGTRSSPQDDSWATAQSLRSRKDSPFHEPAKLASSLLVDAGIRVGPGARELTGGLAGFISSNNIGQLAQLASDPAAFRIALLKEPGISQVDGAKQLLNGDAVKYLAAALTDAIHQNVIAPVAAAGTAVEKSQVTNYGAFIEALPAKQHPTPEATRNMEAALSLAMASLPLSEAANPAELRSSLTELRDGKVPRATSEAIQGAALLLDAEGAGKMFTTIAKTATKAEGLLKKAGVPDAGLKPLAFLEQTLETKKVISVSGEAARMQFVDKMGDKHFAEIVSPGSSGTGLPDATKHLLEQREYVKASELHAQESVNAFSADGSDADHPVTYGSANLAAGTSHVISSRDNLLASFNRDAADSLSQPVFKNYDQQALKEAREYVQQGSAYGAAAASMSRKQMEDANKKLGQIAGIKDMEAARARLEQDYKLTCKEAESRLASTPGWAKPGSRAPDFDRDAVTAGIGLSEFPGMLANSYTDAGLQRLDAVLENQAQQQMEQSTLDKKEKDKGGKKS